MKVIAIDFLREGFKVCFFLVAGFVSGAEQGGLSSNLSVGTKELLNSYESRYGLTFAETVAEECGGKNFLLFEVPASGSRRVYFYYDELDKFENVEKVFKSYFEGDYAEFYVEALPPEEWRGLSGLLRLSFVSDFSLSDGEGSEDPPGIVMASFFNGESIRKIAIEEGINLFRETYSDKVNLSKDEKNSLFFLISSVEYLAVNGHPEIFQRMGAESLANLYIDINEVSLLEYFGDRFDNDYQGVLFELIKTGRLPDETTDSSE
ncbi:MAG: hypothetical protein ACQKBT_00220 [Puniceicoccales bacterium]